jgi:hypothetical protein
MDNQEVIFVKQSKKMRMIKVSILISILLALSGMVATVSAEFPTPPNQFYGTVTIDGEPAPAGTIITAYIDDEPRGSIEIGTAGEYGADVNYLSVTGNESDIGKTITFTVSGSDETGTDVWGRFEVPRRLDIPHVGSTSDDTQGSSSGGTSSSGGGGTGLPGALPTVTPDGATSAPDEGVTPDSPEATITPTKAQTSTTTDESQSGGLLTGYGLMLAIIVAIGLLVAIYLGIRKR